MNLCSPQALSNKAWALVLLAIIVGMATGFSVPLLATYRPQRVVAPQGMERDGETVEVLPTPAEPIAYDVQRDAEVEALAVRNRRLEALVATLRKEKASEAKNAEKNTRPQAAKVEKNNRPLDELGPSQ